MCCFWVLRWFGFGWVFSGVWVWLVVCFVCACYFGLYMLVAVCRVVCVAWCGPGCWCLVCRFVSWIFDVFTWWNCRTVIVFGYFGRFVSGMPLLVFCVCVILGC